MYQKRTVSGSNAGVSVTANTGVAIQNFSISDTKLATTNVLQSGTFSAETEKVTDVAGDAILNLNINGTDYQIPYNDSTSYADLKDKINDVAGSDVTASILQIGDSSYSLVINSKETGKDQQITLSDFGGHLNTNLLSDTLTSGDFDSRTSLIAPGAGAPDTLPASTFTVNAAGVPTTFTYDNTTTLSDLADMINNDATTGAQLYATVIKNDAGAYNLVLTAKNSAEGQSISITDNDGFFEAGLTGLTSQDGGFTDIQTSSDASFKYNGITLTRPSNTVTDITVGITINLLSNDSNANISITQDAQPIKDELQNFVNSYNTMVGQMDSMTLTDTAAGKVGIFNGDNSINSIGREIRRILTSTDSNGVGLAQYGIDLNRDGTLSFDTSAFDAKMAESPEAMADYFSGKTSVDANGNTTSTDGVFTTLYNNLKNLTSANGTITALSDGITTKGKSLQTEKERTVALLNSRYDTMTARFIEYDAMINKLNNQFSSLQQQITMAINSKNN